MTNALSKRRDKTQEHPQHLALLLAATQLYVLPCRGLAAPPRSNKNAESMGFIGSVGCDPGQQSVTSAGTNASPGADAGASSQGTDAGRAYRSTLSAGDQRGRPDHHPLRSVVDWNSNGHHPEGNRSHCL